ncbi:MAG: 16S rRNA (uracil(1498)-N(3))-methyltransferase [Candidatus Omnitrophica bacterium]|nr:16S rRNA (uracil(1498)-N(3))-methyltransferase [Candidatus Omnitrophota bacterium]
MHRFYLPKESFNQPTIQLNDRAEIHHLKNVLRLKKGAAVTIFNGEGKEAEGRIISISSEAVSIDILTVKTIPFSETILSLACAIPKKAKFETIIEKCTELGVNEIIPLITKRTEIHLDAARRQKKASRYQAVAINAARQSKRLSVPAIHPITDFPTAIKMLRKDSLAIIPHLDGERKELPSVINANPKCKRINFFIGPEGDFTLAEVNLAKKAGCIPASLGNTVLKVDTAAIYVIAAGRLLINKH